MCIHISDSFNKTITFHQADATIDLPTFLAQPAGIVRFQFKTSLQNGTILHTTGVEHFLLLKLVGENLY